MTTSSANNSVFRGSFEKQKLTGPNFIDWYRQLRIVLLIEDKLNYPEQPIPSAPVVPAGQHVAPEILKAEQELLQTTRDFHSCKQEEGQSVSSYVLKMKGYIDNLERLGHPMTLGLGPKIPPPPKREDLAKDSICHECGEIGYWKRNFPHSIYAVSNKRAKPDLDSALLWHCRLGHISKKRIEKLQHDGLLNSTDLRAFEKCVPCMSEKMARKPYTHQVERAKDLRGLIHTDHKHKVFETFKVFQKEVENQLDKTIKSLRSDRGGEYISQEFLDHLKDHRIIAHRTPPYTSQHNGVSERRNRTLLDMVRSMMS
nr:hypothetical protein [Tanacetum cinerariifolium]